jgi:hypothetical protein
MRFFRIFSFALLISVTFSWIPVKSVKGQEDPNKKVLKQALLGAGVGAISAEASGGKAGTGALVGAGTNVIGGALLDALTGPSQQPVQQPQYVVQQPQVQYQYVPVEQPQYYQQPQPQPYQQSYPQQSAPRPSYQPSQTVDRDYPPIDIERPKKKSSPGGCARREE